jgi:hypothetical protein
MPQAERSPVRDQDDVDFSIYLILLDNGIILRILDSTQPLTEMSTRDSPGGKKWSAPRADNLDASCEPNVSKLWEPEPLTNIRASTTCTGIVLTFTLGLITIVPVSTLHSQTYS